MDEQRTFLTLFGLSVSKHVLGYIVERLNRSTKTLVGHVSRLVLYPLKSGGPIEVEAAYCDWLCMENAGLKDRWAKTGHRFLFSHFQGCENQKHKNSLKRV